MPVQHGYNRTPSHHVQHCNRPMYPQNVRPHIVQQVAVPNTQDYVSMSENSTVEYDNFYM